jgi:hypothetical protein
MIRIFIYVLLYLFNLIDNNVRPDKNSDLELSIASINELFKPINFSMINDMSIPKFDTCYFKKYILAHSKPFIKSLPYQGKFHKGTFMQRNNYMKSLMEMSQKLYEQRNNKFKPTNTIDMIDSKVSTDSTKSTKSTTLTTSIKLTTNTVNTINTINMINTNCHEKKCFYPPNKCNDIEFAGLIFVEDFKNFNQKLLSSVWVNLVFDDPIDPANNPPVISDDGVIVQECDGVILNSDVYKKILPHPLTPYNYGVCRILPYDNAALGICIEFVVSQNTFGIGNIKNTIFSDYYETNGYNPKKDFRLANSSVSFFDFTDDFPFAQITFTKKKIYFMYGIGDHISGIRDSFVAAIPILKRKGKWNEKFMFRICVGYDGSIDVHVKNDDTCEYACILHINNIGVPPKNKKYIKLINSRSYADNPVAPSTFIFEPITLSVMSVCIGNYKYMHLMDTLNFNLDSNHLLNTESNYLKKNYYQSNDLPTTVLYDVNGDLQYKSMRYLCKNTLTVAESLITLPDVVSTDILNFGQGAAIKIYNLTAYYYA